jgi:hypothetical protein
LKQIVLAAVLDDCGRPVCCEILPGNTADITTLVPLIDRLRERFGISEVCVVADRGMISAKTIGQLTQRGIHYILGARLRNVKEISEEVLSRGGRYREVHGPRRHSKSPSPLKVKQVMVEDRRYIVCHNEEQARKDRADREAIVAKLRDSRSMSAKKPLVSGSSATLPIESRCPIQIMVTRSVSLYGSGRRSTPLTTLKMAALAPIPKARVSTETAVKSGARTSRRTGSVPAVRRAVFQEDGMKRQK